VGREHSVVRIAQFDVAFSMGEAFLLEVLPLVSGRGRRTREVFDELELPLLFKQVVVVLLEGLNFILVELNGGHQVIVLLLEAAENIDVPLTETPVGHRPSIDVVHLMHEHAGMEVEQLLLLLIAFLIEVLDLDTNGAVDHAAHVGETEAVFPLVLSRGGLADEGRVEEDFELLGVEDVVELVQVFFYLFFLFRDVVASLASSVQLAKFDQYFILLTVLLDRLRVKPLAERSILESNEHALGKANLVGRKRVRATEGSRSLQNIGSQLYSRVLSTGDPLSSRVEIRGLLTSILDDGQGVRVW